MEGWIGTHAEWVASLHGKDAVIDFYTANGLQQAGRMKLWQGVISVKSSEWECDISTAGFTKIPIITAQPITSVAIGQVSAFVNLNASTATRAKGFATFDTAQMDSFDMLVCAMGY